MPQLCEHTLERTIQHWPSGYDQLTGRRLYKAGDAVVLTCPYGCEPIIINVVDNREEEERENA